MDEKNLPDNYVPNARSLPYASDLGAPVIKPNHDLGGWKISSVHRANKHFEEKFEKLKKEFVELSNNVKWNEILFNAEMKFKPVIGKEYYLYKKDQEKYFLSLFSPNECSWGEKYEGTFRLNYDNRWDIIDLNVEL